MTRSLIVGTITGLLVVVALPRVALSQQRDLAKEYTVPVGKTALYARVVGQGRPIIILHGGPDFDHGYLLPGFDSLASFAQLIYYDQRGRGRSAADVDPADVNMASEIADVERVREHFKLERAVVLGHSWGAVLALEYALRHPERVSHLVLLNAAPASTSDLRAVREEYLERLGSEMDRQREIASGAAYRAGDPSAVAERYRIHFKPSLKYNEHYEELMETMARGFRQQGSQGILKARAVEDRLMSETWERPEYDLLPRLGGLQIRTLVVVGEHDFMLSASQRISQAMATSEIVTLRDCGHFPFLECPAELWPPVIRFIRQ